MTLVELMLTYGVIKKLLRTTRKRAHDMESNTVNSALRAITAVKACLLEVMEHHNGNSRPSFTRAECAYELAHEY